LYVRHILDFLDENVLLLSLIDFPFDGGVIAIEDDGVIREIFFGVVFLKIKTKNKLKMIML